MDFWYMVSDQYIIAHLKTVLYNIGLVHAPGEYRTLTTESFVKKNE